MRGTVMGKDGLAIFKVKVTVRAHNDNQNNDSFYCSAFDVFATKTLLDSTISWSVLWKGWLLCSSSRSLGRLNILMNVYLDDILWTAEPLLAKLRMVVHYYKLECYAKRVVWCHQGQGHSEGLYNQNIHFYPTYWTAYPYAAEFSLTIYIITHSVLGTYLIAVFKVTEKVQNCIECLTSYIFCTTDLFATKPSVLTYYCWWWDQVQIKSAYILFTSNSSMIYSI